MRSRANHLTVVFPRLLQFQTCVVSVPGLSALRRYSEKARKHYSTGHVRMEPSAQCEGVEKRAKVLEMALTALSIGGNGNCCPLSPRLVFRVHSELWSA